MNCRSSPAMILLRCLGMMGVVGILLTLQAFALPGKRPADFKPGFSRPLKITCLTIGSRGDVQPFIALGLGLQQDGHTVTIATHLEFKQMIEDAGIAFKNIGGNPQELIKHCVEHGFFSPDFFIQGYTKFRAWIDELLVTVPAACEGADLLIETPTAMMGIHVAERMKIPYFRAFTMPWTPTTQYPHPFAATPQQLGKYYNLISYHMFNYFVWKGIESKVNRWREDKLKLKPTSFAKLQTIRVPILYNFSEHIVPKPPDWDQWTHVTGYWFRDQQQKQDRKTVEESISPELRAFLHKAKAQHKKVIYIGFGSVIFPNAGEVQWKLERAVRKAGVWAVVSGGWSHMTMPRPEQDRESTQWDSAQDSPIHYVRAVPHEWLFSQVDATLTHGGAGTTAASLRAGIPTLIKPFFGDQFFWAKLVKQMGVGTHVKSFKVSELARALRTAVTDADQIHRAETIGKAIRQENGVRTAIMKIYQDMNHARRLMMLGMGKGEAEPVPKFPKEQVYFWLKSFIQRKRASIHYILLFILRALQYSSITKQSLGYPPASPHAQSQLSSTNPRNFSLSASNQTATILVTSSPKNHSVF